MQAFWLQLLFISCTNLQFCMHSFECKCFENTSTIFLRIIDYSDAVFLTAATFLIPLSSHDDLETVNQLKVISKNTTKSSTNTITALEQFAICSSVHILNLIMCRKHRSSYILNLTKYSKFDIFRRFWEIQLKRNRRSQFWQWNQSGSNWIDSSVW